MNSEKSRYESDSLVLGVVCIGVELFNRECIDAATGARHGDG